AVEHLEHALDTHPHAGVAGPAVLARSDPSRVASLGITYAVGTGRMRHLGHQTLSASISPGVQPVDAVGGCVMLIAREVFDRVGVFDERYFFTFEDLEFCLRARRAGIVTVRTGRARAHHQGGQSIGPHSPDRLYYAARNHL